MHIHTSLSNDSTSPLRESRLLWFAGPESAAASDAPEAKRDLQKPTTIEEIKAGLIAKQKAKEEAAKKEAAEKGIEVNKAETALDDALRSDRTPEQGESLRKLGLPNEATPAQIKAAALKGIQYVMDDIERARAHQSPAEFTKANTDYRAEAAKLGVTITDAEITAQKESASREKRRAALEKKKESRADRAKKGLEEIPAPESLPSTPAGTDKSPMAGETPTLKPYLVKAIQEIQGSTKFSELEQSTFTTKIMRGAGIRIDYTLAELELNNAIKSAVNASKQGSSDGRNDALVQKLRQVESIVGAQRGIQKEMDPTARPSVERVPNAQEKLYLEARNKFTVDINQLNPAKSTLANYKAMVVAFDAMPVPPEGNGSIQIEIGGNKTPVKMDLQDAAAQIRRKLLGRIERFNTANIAPDSYQMVEGANQVIQLRELERFEDARAAQRGGSPPAPSSVPRKSATPALPDIDLGPDPTPKALPDEVRIRQAIDNDGSLTPAQKDFVKKYLIDQPKGLAVYTPEEIAAYPRLTDSKLNDTASISVREQKLLSSINAIKNGARNSPSPSAEVILPLDLAEARNPRTARAYELANQNKNLTPDDRAVLKKICSAQEAGTPATWTPAEQAAYPTSTSGSLRNAPLENLADIRIRNAFIEINETLGREEKIADAGKVLKQKLKPGAGAAFRGARGRDGTVMSPDGTITDPIGPDGKRASEGLAELRLKQAEDARRAEAEKRKTPDTAKPVDPKAQIKEPIPAATEIPATAPKQPPEGPVNKQPVTPEGTPRPAPAPQKGTLAPSTPETAMGPVGRGVTGLGGAERINKGVGTLIDGKGSAAENGEAAVNVAVGSVEMLAALGLLKETIGKKIPYLGAALQLWDVGKDFKEELDKGASPAEAYTKAVVHGINGFVSGGMITKEASDQWVATLYGVSANIGSLMADYASGNIKSPSELNSRLQAVGTEFVGGWLKATGKTTPVQLGDALLKVGPELADLRDSNEKLHARYPKLSRDDTSMIQFVNLVQFRTNFIPEGDKQNLAAIEKVIKERIDTMKSSKNPAAIEHLSNAMRAKQELETYKKQLSSVQYLNDNTDVAAYLAQGGPLFKTAREHYEKYGQNEGRKWEADPAVLSKLIPAPAPSLPREAPEEPAKEDPSSAGK